MRPRLALAAAILLGLAAALGWTAAWREHQQQTATAAFTRQRLAFLETENARLREALSAKARAEFTAAEAAERTTIEHDVARLRQLEFLNPIVYKQIPRSDLPALLRQKLAQQLPDQQFATDAISLAALGLLPPGIDLKTTYLDLLSEQIGAFYDQHTRELYTFSGQPLSNAQNRVILAHELTHALEDQHFSLAGLPIETKGNDDRALAATALVEGDATLVMNQYMLGNLSGAVLRDTLTSAMTTDVRRLAAAPRYLRETLLFPYLRGQEFCQSLYASAGWPALAAAFRHPPASTAEILHPERYLTEPRLSPIVIDFQPTAVLGEQPIDDNVLGEFGLRQLFARWLPAEPAANNTAAGWRGDRYLVYGNAKAAGYIWRIACADDAAAGKLAAMFRQSIAARYKLPADVSGNPILVPASSRQIAITMNAQHEVNIIDAPDARWREALAAQFVLSK